MTLPYADDPGNVGLPCLPPWKLEAIVLKAARKRIQIAFHAIGDRAVHGRRRAKNLGITLHRLSHLAERVSELEKNLREINAND